MQPTLDRLLTERFQNAKIVQSIDELDIVNTPSHIAASLLAWRNEDGLLPVSAVMAGAVIPDLPMFGFYAYQRLWAGSSEREIWSRLYFEESWQYFFDLFNSIPFAIALIVLFNWLGLRWGVLFAASALLHMCCDLPLHNDDAHRHFLPLVDWRFHSPISYWDPRHYGQYFALFELCFSVVACGFVCWKAGRWPLRIAATGTLMLYAVGIGFALVMWVF